MAVKAILFDCFGVLVTESWLAFKRQHFGDNPSKMVQASSLIDQADSGVITHQQFLEKVANMAGMSVEEVDRHLDTNVTNTELFEYMDKQLKPNYKIGMLSNAASNWLRKFFSEKQLALFDVVTLSYETGLIKPNPEAFEYIAEKLGVASSECVLVDDQERHLNTAREVGMQTVLYQDFEQMKRDLDQITQAQTRT